MMEARAYFAVILLSLSLLLLLGVRDHRGVAQQMSEQRECVAGVVADGAPGWLAVRECSVRLHVPVRTIDENLP